MPVKKKFCKKFCMDIFNALDETGLKVAAYIDIYTKYHIYTFMNREAVYQTLVWRVRVRVEGGGS